MTFRATLLCILYTIGKGHNRDLGLFKFRNYLKLVFALSP